jgi:hypothetical protein
MRFTVASAQDVISFASKIFNREKKGGRARVE